MKAAFYTLGCKVNQYETRIMEQKLLKAGFEIVDPASPADVYIINSCTVTAEGDRKTRQILHRFKAQNSDAKIVLTGCFPQSSPEKAGAISEADVITGTKERVHIDEILKQALSKNCRIVEIAPFEKEEPFDDVKAEDFYGRTRADVKIEDGCERYCSYCIIPFSRGPVRSKTPSALKDELEGLSAKGFKEIVLVGINLSAYGKDLGLSLADAIETACSVHGIERVRLGSLEPNIITDEFISRVSGLPNLCPHFHLSLQSGCAETLRRMNRHYTPDEYESAVLKLRNAFHPCSITTDVIVGFPGETETEFLESLDFVKKIRFTQAHIFAYSKRSGTRAAEMTDQIEKREKERRSRLMIDACLDIRRDILNGYNGKTVPVLFESQKPGSEWEGYTPEYVPVVVKTDEDIRGKIIETAVMGSNEKFCEGKLI